METSPISYLSPDFGTKTIGDSNEMSVLPETVLDDDNELPFLDVDNDFDSKLYIRYQNKEELNDLDIISVEEEYKSADVNYIIANVRFKSLFNIYNKPENKLFVCAV